MAYAPTSAIGNEFPPQILLHDLQQHHPEYDKAKLRKYSDLYEGGSKFHQNIEKYLIKRQIEMSGPGPSFNPKSSGAAMDYNNPLQDAGAKQWQARVRRAWYTPIVSGMIDFMVAAVFQNQPTVVAADPKQVQKKETLLGKLLSMIRGRTDDIETSRTAYWHEVNRDADGMGTDLAAVLREALLQVMLHKRAYLAVKFPGYNGELESDPEESTEGNICLLKAENVDDWQLDKFGHLIWIRTHFEEATRSSEWKQPDQCKHTWTYFTASGIYQYWYEYVNGQSPDATAYSVALQSYKAHDLGQIPIVPINVHDGLWVMERLADTVLALFNRQSAAGWTLDQMAFALLVLFTDKDLSTVDSNGMAALKLMPSDRAEFVTPSSTIFDAQQKDIDRLKEELFLAIQAMVLVAAAKDEQGRQSGVAKQRDFGALTTLLEAFASPIRDGLEKAVEMIKNARGDDDIIVAVQGLDKFDVQSLEIKIKNATSFLTLNGVPDSAKRWVLLDTSLAMTSNAPAEVRENVVNEMISEQPAPATITANPNDIPIIAAPQNNNFPKV